MVHRYTILYQRFLQGIFLNSNCIWILQRWITIWLKLWTSSMTMSIFYTRCRCISSSSLISSDSSPSLTVQQTTSSDRAPTSSSRDSWWSSSDRGRSCSHKARNLPKWLKTSGFRLTISSNTCADPNNQISMIAMQISKSTIYPSKRKK